MEVYADQLEVGDAIAIGNCGVRIDYLGYVEERGIIIIEGFDILSGEEYLDEFDPDWIINRLSI